MLTPMPFKKGEQMSDINPTFEKAITRTQRNAARISQSIEKNSNDKLAACKVCGKVFKQKYYVAVGRYSDYDVCDSCRKSQAKGESTAVIEYNPHPKQQLVHDGKTRFKVIAAGARFGKDRCMINEFVKQFCDMLSEDRKKDMIPSVHGWIVAPTYILARQSWRELQAFFPREWVDNYWAADRMISTINDGVIEVRSADDPQGLVSVGLDIVLITEAAKIKNFDEVWTNIENRLMSPGRGPNGQGGVGLINSTPSGRNFFYKMYKWGRKDDPDYDPEWESWNFSSFDNPYFTRKDKNWAESIKKRYPERIFRQEIMGEFLPEGSSMFPSASDCATYQGSREPLPHEVYVIGYDPAKSIDNAGVAIRNSKGETVEVQQWKGLGWNAQYDRIEYLSRYYNNASIIMDKTGLGETIPEQLTLRGLDVEGVFFTAIEKERMVNNLAILIEQKIISYPNYEPLINELNDYEYNVTKRGNIQFGATSSNHDDLVTGMMLAYRDFIVVEMAMPFVGLFGGLSHKKHSDTKIAPRKY